MIDNNKNFEKHFLNQIMDFDEATLLSPNLGGSETPKLAKNEFELNFAVKTKYQKIFSF